jgi:hypothetical protein
LNDVPTYALAVRLVGRTGVGQALLELLDELELLELDELDEDELDELDEEQFGTVKVA